MTDKVKDLASLSKKELSEFLNSFDTILCDVDGVIQNASVPIPGAKDTIELMRELGKEIYFVTNNCVLTLNDFHKKLRNNGYNIRDGHIFNPTTVILNYLKEINFKKKIFLFTIQGLKKEFQDAGYEVVDAHEIKIEGKPPLSLFPIVKDLDPDVGAVYFDNDVAFNYIALQQAIEYLKKPEVLLFGSGADKLLPVMPTINFMGPGFFFDIIKTMTGKEPLLMGKPEKLINEYIIKKINSPTKTLFIGDALHQDVKFAKLYGYQSVLVLSGVSAKSDLDDPANQEFLPDYYIKNLLTLGEIIKQNRVLILYKALLPGSKEFIDLLEENDKNVLFVSNNSLLRLSEYHVKLKQLGFNVRHNELVTPITVALDYLKENNFNKKMYCISQNGLKEDLKEAGYQLIDARQNTIDDSSFDSFLKSIEDVDSNVGAVYVDVDFMFSGSSIQKAIRYLQGTNVVLFGSGSDKVVPANDTVTLMGPGYLHDILKELTGKEPILFGKPGIEMKKYLQKRIKTNKTIVIGDSLDQDVQLGKICGFKTLLVLSGVSKKTDFDNHGGKNISPDYFVKSIDVFRRLIEKHLRYFKK
ncbi:uncharacterized protein LOC108739187 [Agrilus planipennis]|uniref:Uncharacterized protein LOC108739187 n=1 Tax=Agrilus planipennis TaxID=224129 RepID=A0A1W4WX60_AGRPL|nr:uncharacterized protein LOC108739187 [Agrilus planipennis]